jgi:hypothetical protein
VFVAAAEILGLAEPDGHGTESEPRHMDPWLKLGRDHDDRAAEITTDIALALFEVKEP